MPRLRKAERLRRERISRSLLAYYREQRRAERLRRERISDSLLAYHREQRRLREARAEAARHYWRRVKQAAGRHGLTVPQARRVIGLAVRQAILVTQAARQVKRIPRVPVRPPAPPRPARPPVLPPPPPVPILPVEPEPPLPAPGLWAASEVTRQEIAWNLRDVVEGGYERDPRDLVRETGTLEAEFNVFVDGRYRRTERVEFESSPDDDTFWYNFHAAAREVHEDTMEQWGDVKYDQISVTAMAIRMA